MNRYMLVAVIVVGLTVLAVLGIPIKQTCPRGPCATAPDAQGNIHYYYETKPLGVTLIEGVTGSVIPISYTSGEELEKIR